MEARKHILEARKHNLEARKHISNTMSSTQHQHAKEATMNHLRLPMEIVDTIKSFTFYDINTAKKIKKTKAYKRILMRIFKEANYSNYKTTTERMFLEMDEENMVFQEGDIWRFGFVNHPRETLYIESQNCLQCGNYVSTFYTHPIQCKCNRQIQLFNLPSFFV